MKKHKKPATLVICLLLLSLVVAQGSDHRTKLSQVRSVSLPSSSILDKHAQPLISSNGKIGFVASVTGGSLISFSMTSGKILSSIAVGETLGSISMIETGGHRLIAVPAANDPSSGGPATVSIIDATNAKMLESKALLVLPKDAVITPSTSAVLTNDGQFCLIASSFDVPTLFSFDVETGALLAHLALSGRPSEISLFDDGTKRRLAIASAAGNSVSIIKIDGRGALVSNAIFSPSIAQFDEANNPTFSADGSLIYVAAATGDRLFAIDSESAIIIDSISINSPERISIAATPDKVEIIAVTRSRQPSKPGGVSIVATEGGRLTARSEFTPPEGVDFSLANNVAFTDDTSVAFVGSSSGMLFAFNTNSGELESYQAVGSEIRRVALSEKTHTVAAVRSASTGDEVTIVNFDVVGPDESNPAAPLIDTMQPDIVEQGRVGNLKLLVSGKNLSEGASLVVNGVEMGADLVRNGSALETKLPKALFSQIASINVAVKGADGTLSLPKELRVVRPDVPLIESISPGEIPGPSGPFTLRVNGRNFRASSSIVVGGRALNTQQTGSTSLQAIVPADIADRVRAEGLKIQVKDLAVPDLVSVNDKELHIYGPRITALQTSVRTVVAGGRSFELKIAGSNFREGAQVELHANGDIFTPVQIKRVSSRSIRLTVPTHIVQDSGNLAVVVRNPDGSKSEARDLEVRAPEITSFGQSKVYAGSSDVKIDIHGDSFRPNARVYVGNARVENTQVRFRSSSHLVVTLNGDLNRLLQQPEMLRFQVVNPNEADGVPSQDKALSIVGPRVSDASIQANKDDSSKILVVIQGANFRQDSTVEFFKIGMEEAPVLQQKPISVSDGQMVVAVSARKLERMGGFRVRVVNNGTAPVASTLVQPRQMEIAKGDD